MMRRQPLTTSLAVTVVLAACATDDLRTEGPPVPDAAFDVFAVDARPSDVDSADGTTDGSGDADGPFDAGRDGNDAALVDARDGSSDGGFDASDGGKPCTTTCDFECDFTLGSCATVAHLSAGGSASCAVMSTGSLYCWGDLRSLSSPSITSSRPTRIGELSTQVASIGVGSDFACERRADGSVWCWGNNDKGQLGMAVDAGSVPKPASRVRVDLGGARATGFIANQDLTLFFAVPRSCVLATDGVRCWGKGDPIPTLTRQTSIVSLAVGAQHQCYLTSAGVHCWGAAFPEGPLGSEGEYTSPTAIGLSYGGVAPYALTTNSLHTCLASGRASAAASDMRCIGKYPGNGSETFSPTASRLTNTGCTAQVTELASGVAHTCLLCAEGSVHCWGINSVGQSGGTTTSTSHLSPVEVLLPSGVVADRLKVGTQHACVRTTKGDVYCWGSNGAGQLGDGTTTHSPKPVRAKVR